MGSEMCIRDRLCLRPFRLCHIAFLLSLFPDDFVDFDYQDMAVFDKFFADCTQYIKLNINYISVILQAIRNEMSDFEMFVNMLELFVDSKVSIQKGIDIARFAKFCGDYMRNNNNMYYDVPFDIAMSIMFDLGNDFVVIDCDLDNIVR